MNSDFIRTLPGNTFAEQLDFYGRHILPDLHKSPIPVTIPMRGRSNLPRRKGDLQGIGALAGLAGGTAGLALLINALRKRKSKKRSGRR